MLACISDKSQVEGEVMDTGYLHGQQFLSLEKVVEIGLGVYTVYFAAIRIDRREVVLPLLVAHVHGSLIGEEHGVATISGGHDTIEHVDATLDGLEDVLWGAYPHQVTGTVLGQNLIDDLDHVVHHLCGLSYSQSANRGPTTVAMGKSV